MRPLAPPLSLRSSAAGEPDGLNCHAGPMATQFPEITRRHEEFIAAQQVFFVATAARDGRVNVSPKGLDSFRVLGPHEVAWLNGTGSGNETAAHVLDHPRMTVMFCSFTDKPLILRLYGTARMTQPGDDDWSEAAALFPPLLGARQVFRLTVDMVQTSCGFGVPTFEFEAQRTTMHDWATKKGPEGLAAYRREHNARSLDGYPTALPD